MIKDFSAQLDEARTLADIFEVVKSAVLKCMGKSRAGLMLGMANLGNSPQTFLGAFYPVGSNVIVMNKIPLQRIQETRPELFKPYAFHVLMHEYIHTLGYLDESLVRSKVRDVTVQALGPDHLAARLAADTHDFFQHLVYPDTAWEPDEDKIDLVSGFDRSSTAYIG
jgi:hypothetical protein